MHETSVRVRYADTDKMKVAYYANYPVWFEVGRAELLRAHGYPYSDMERDGFILPVSRVEYRLVQPARYDELLTVETTVARLRSRSVTFQYRVLRGPDLLVEGMTEHICVNPEHRPTAFPPKARAALGMSQ